MKVGVYTPDKNWKLCKLCGSYYNGDKYPACPITHAIEIEGKKKNESKCDNTRKG